MAYPNTDDKPSVPYEHLIMHRDLISLPEGQIAFTYPAKISAKSYEYLERFLQLELDRIKDSIEVEAK